MSVDQEKEVRHRWLVRQEELATESGLAISIVDRDGYSPIAESNNNSVCSVVRASPAFKEKCNQYCGRVHAQAAKTGKPFKFKCHAGLECVAVPIKIKGKKPAAAIIGRAFTKAEDYRKATEKAISGEWSKFAPSAVFENVLLNGSQSVESLAKKLVSLDAGEIALIASFLEPEEPEVAKKERPSAKKPTFTREVKAKEDKREVVKPPPLRLPKVKDITQREMVRARPPQKPSKKAPQSAKRPAPSDARAKSGDAAEQAAWRSLFGDLTGLTYGEACKLVLRYLSEHFEIGSLAWLENRGNRLTTSFAMGRLRNQKIKVSVATDDPRMRKVMLEEISIELRERPVSGQTAPADSVRLFPIVVGGEIRSALVVGDRTDESVIVDSVSRFCKTVASELEILRLREELSKRSWLDIALRKFNASLKMIDSDEFWVRLMQTTAELMRAERGSLLIHDEKSGELTVKAAIGRRADLLMGGVEGVGDRIAKGVWEKGEALVVRDISKTGLKASPDEWKYQTDSFISYPLVIGDRKIGVLNIADKVDGEAYTEEEVKLLNSLVPQIAVAADRASLKNKAGEYEQLSVTDPLTGLLNRRYLEERLAEEIMRSERHGYPMSFMMIDVDDFKSYNDEFLHPEGDKALKIVGHCLRETLRGADVAARYGGEEFSILLPQTTIDEAMTIAERIRTNIETADIPHRQVTVSIGIATLSPSIDSVEKLVKCADKALFAAKREGKNQVNVFGEPGTGQRAAVH